MTHRSIRILQVVVVLVSFQITSCSPDYPDQTTSEPSLPAETTISISQMLGDYPLHVGSTWTYQVTIEYQDFHAESGSSLVNTWSGKVTESILSREQTDDGSIRFTALMEDHPTLVQGKVEVGDLKGEYVISEGGIDNNNYRILQWPLDDGSRWVFSEEDHDVWVILFIEDVVTPAGFFEECYVLGMWTGPESTNRWFCTGIGFVKENYRHPGTAYKEYWELIEYSFTN